eukprot:543502-Amphidinium_carterae.1
MLRQVDEAEAWEAAEALALHLWAHAQEAQPEGFAVGSSADKHYEFFCSRKACESNLVNDLSDAGDVHLDEMLDSSACSKFLLPLHTLSPATVGILLYYNLQSPHSFEHASAQSVLIIVGVLPVSYHKRLHCTAPLLLS